MVAKVAVSLVILIVLIAGGLAAAIVFGTEPPPPPLKSIGAGGQKIQRGVADRPPPETFLARDDTALGFRRYPGQPGEGLAILVHGSSGSSAEMHQMGKALSSAGVTALAIDIRGHGATTRRGDISYAGQLDDDMTDLLQFVEKTYPGERRVLIGHSSGGGYVLHVAASSLACAFKGFVALSPYLNHAAPTVRPDTGGWARPYIPRIVALTILRRVGLTQFEDLPVIAFAIPDGADETLVRNYSFRLLADFGLDADWKGAIGRIARPTRVFVGEKDELFYPDAFEPVFKLAKPPIPVVVASGIDHMGIVLDSDAVDAEVEAAKSLIAEPSVKQCAL